MMHNQFKNQGNPKIKQIRGSDNGVDARLVSENRKLIYMDNWIHTAIQLIERLKFYFIRK